jgi:hypothetical protein
MRRSTPIRVVIQRVQHVHEKTARFRLIAYTDGEAFRPVEFTSKERLLAAISHLVPKLASSLCAIPAVSGTEIVFSDVLHLSEQQILQLGLSDEKPQEQE